MANEMKISEHIRAGAKLRPGGGGSFFTLCQSDNPFPGVFTVGSCALGALAESVKLVEGLDTLTTLKSITYADVSKIRVDTKSLFALFPVLLEKNYYCPVCPSSENGEAVKPSMLDEIIVHINDEHRWSREAIADFLEEKGL